ncbi:MAG: zeta toxin family protein [Acidimicrobiales bacterium]
MKRPTKPPVTRHVIVSDEEYGLPYSKGLMATGLMATGIAPGRAFQVAEVIEERLLENFTDTITQVELTCLALAVLQEEVGERYSDLYAKWQTLKRLAMPLIILLGGPTGAGKSTIATMLANRLGITRVIPTDAIREVMRAMFSGDLLPTLHSSSFDTHRVIRHPVPRDSDPVIAGFREQASAVAVGIEALMRRAIDEGTHLIVEGAHVVPGFLDRSRYAGQAIVVPLLISVDDEDLHRSHFVLRGATAGSRPSDRYLENFDNIRRIHQYLMSMADEHDVPVVQSYNLDTTLVEVIDLVVTEAIRNVPEASDTSDLPVVGEAAARPAGAVATTQKRGTP